MAGDLIKKQEVPLVRYEASKIIEPGKTGSGTVRND